MAPEVDSSAELARAYARYLTAAAAAIHALLGHKELGLNIADWTVIAPEYWPLYNRTGVDLFATMTPTYSYIYSAWPYVTSLAHSLQPLGRVDIGVASTLQPSGPAGGRCRGEPFNRSSATPLAQCNSSRRDPGEFTSGACHL